VFTNNGNPTSELPTEEMKLALVLTGSWQEKSWQEKEKAVNFFHLKGAVEKIFETFGILEEITYEPLADRSDLHPGRSAEIFLKEAPLGFIGQVHPQLAKIYEIPETYVLEIAAEDLFNNLDKEILFSDVNKFPEVERDIALLVGETVGNQAVVQEIKNHGGRFLKNVLLFDVYIGENIEQSSRSLAYTLTFANPEATLTDEEINLAMEKIEKALVSKLNVQIR
jgi:phenylalanyl-tRNA synthetase beta chain